MKNILVGFLLLFPTLSNGQETKELKFSPAIDFLKMPSGWYLQEVAGVAVNSEDHIFVFHRGKHPLLEFDADGKFIRSIAEDLFVSPHGLRIDKYDNLWTTDVGSHVVLKFSKNLELQMVLGKWNTAGEETKLFGLFSHLFNKPTDVGFDSQDNIFITDGYENSRIMKFDRDGVFIKSWGTKGDSVGQFNVPHTIVVDKDNLVYVGDRQNKRIQIFNTEGKFLSAWDNIGYPWGLVQYSNKFYMTDGHAGKLIELSKEGKIIGTYGGSGKKPGQFGWPHMIAVDSKGNLYIAEILNWRMQKLTVRK
ncbi:MAG TPA: peptidyl-alpha-hydroxyglycine alpha-amidating lyase family protein [Chryseolinea sp.]